MESPQNKHRSNVGNVDLVNKLVAVGLRDLGVPDVLAALQESSINNLEDFIAGGLEKAKAVALGPSPIGSNATEHDQNGNAIRHRVPQIPVLIDGILYDPKDIQKFNGEMLHFVCKASRDELKLHAFRGTEWREALKVYSRVRLLSSAFDTSIRPSDWGGWGLASHRSVGLEV